MNYIHDESGNGNRTKVEMINADFMKYEILNNMKFDFLLCNQVLEHAPSPASFMKKLISSARISIILVPFYWDDCEACNHATHNITHEMLLDWSDPHEPIHTVIVAEDRQSAFNKMIILVYKTLKVTR